MTPAQKKALSLLADSDGLTAKEFFPLMWPASGYYSKSCEMSAAGYLGKLAGKGWVKKCRDDGWLYTFRITRAGRDQLASTASRPARARGCSSPGTPRTPRAAGDPPAP